MKRFFVNIPHDGKHFQTVDKFVTNIEKIFYFVKYWLSICKLCKMNVHCKCKNSQLLSTSFLLDKYLSNNTKYVTRMLHGNVTFTSPKLSFKRYAKRFLCMIKNQ